MLGFSGDYGSFVKRYRGARPAFSRGRSGSSGIGQFDGGPPAWTDVPGSPAGRPAGSGSSACPVAAGARAPSGARCPKRSSGPEVCGVGGGVPLPALRFEGRELPYFRSLTFFIVLATSSFTLTTELFVCVPFLYCQLRFYIFRC